MTRRTANDGGAKYAYSIIAYGNDPTLPGAKTEDFYGVSQTAVYDTGRMNTTEFTFPEGATSTTITIYFNPDGVTEGNEQYGIVVYNSLNAVDSYDTGPSTPTYYIDDQAPANTAPIAVADSKSVNEDATVAGNVLNNDSDDGGAQSLLVNQITGPNSTATIPAGAQIVIHGTYGTLAIKSDGSYSYSVDQPAADALAQGQAVSENFTYQVSDAGGLTNTAALTFNITGVNDAPVVSGTVTGAATEDGASSTLNAIANATDVDSTTLTPIDIPTTLPAGVTYNASTKSFTLDPTNAAYQPLIVGQLIPVTVNYRVSDGQTSTAAAVSWTVIGTNDVPVATPDTQSLNENATVTATVRNTTNGSIAGVLANDTDVDAGQTGALVVSGAHKGTVAGTADQSVSGSAATAIVGEYGTLNIRADGTYSYTADSAKAEALAQNAAAADVFTYTVRDRSAATTTSTLTFNITGVNDAPVVSGPVTGAATEDGASSTLNAIANATDVDSATLTPIDIPTTLPAGVTYNPSTKSFTLDPTNAAYQPLAAGQQTPVIVSYRVSDGTTSTAASVSWTVTGTNDLPVATADAQALSENATVTATVRNTTAGSIAGVLANDSDVDSGHTGALIVSGAHKGTAAGTADQAVSFSGSTAIVGEYGTLNINADGTYSYTADSAKAEALAQGAAATDVFTYTVRDPANGSATSTLTFNITGVNDAPVVSGTVTGAATEDGASSTLNAIANATDVDSTTLTPIDIPTTLPAGVTYSAATKSFTLDPTNAAYQSLAGGQQTTVTVAYRVSDGQTSTAASALWTVTGTNDAPVLDLNGAADGTNSRVRFVEGDPGVNLAPALSLNDIDSNIASVTLTPNGLKAGEFLTINGANSGTVTGLAISVDPATGALTLSGNASAATYQAALRQAQFESNTSSPSSSVTVTVIAKDTAGTASASATATVDVTSFAISATPAVEAREGDVGAANKLTFTVTRSDISGGAVTLYLKDASGTGVGAATVGTDYTLPTSVTFAADKLEATFDVLINGDNAVETNELVKVDLYRTATLTGVAVASAAGTILDDDATYTLRDASVAEGNSGTTALTFTVTRDTAGFATTLYAVPYGLTGPNGATAGEDFSAAVQTVSFAAGEISKTFTILVNGDTKIENTENLGVNLYNVLSSTTGAYSVLRASATGTITADDVPVTDTVSPRFLVSDGINAATLTGASGNDTYVVSNPQTAIVDGQNGGTDIVYVSTEFGLTTYALNGGAFIETISAQEQQGTAALNLTGNFYAQTLIGNNGANILNGNGGADTLIGLGGDDTYAIADASAVIVEQPGQGYDRVYTSVSYTLTGTAAVEELGFTNQGGTENLNLIGNAFDQKMVGNYGDNVLNGNGGVDTLIGLLGNDIYVVGDARTVVIENSGEGFDTVFANTSYTLAAGASIELLSVATQGGTEAYDLTGNGFAQAVIGNNGANVLDGGAGADTLTGLVGADTFRFSTALGGGNVDTITDFGNGADRISLASGIFSGLATGTLAATSFTAGTTAVGTAAQIVYNQATGQLFYDADGAGSGAAVLFATVTPATMITASMIAVA